MRVIGVLFCQLMVMFAKEILIFADASVHASSIHSGGCLAPGEIKNGNIHLENDHPNPGDAVKYTCNENYTMMGSRTRHCMTNGRWTGEAPTCEKLCPFPHTTQHVKIKVNPYLIGSPLRDSNDNEVLAELEFDCDPNYTLVGSKRIRCAGGVWDQKPPSCELELRCANPGTPENGQCISQDCLEEEFNSGGQLKFKCQNGYTLVGMSTIICMPSGFWSASIPLCLPKVITQCKCTCDNPAGAQDLLKNTGSSFACITESKAIVNLNDSEYVVLKTDN